MLTAALLLLSLLQLISRTDVMRCSSLADQGVRSSIYYVLSTIAPFLPPD